MEFLQTGCESTHSVFQKLMVVLELSTVMISRPRELSTTWPEMRHVTAALAIQYTLHFHMAVIYSITRTYLTFSDASSTDVTSVCDLSV